MLSVLLKKKEKSRPDGKDLDTKKTKTATTRLSRQIKQSGTITGDELIFYMLMCFHCINFHYYLNTYLTACVFTAEGVGTLDCLVEVAASWLSSHGKSAAISNKLIFRKF